jgi:pyrroline-5-carboxylate reductase
VTKRIGILGGGSMTPAIMAMLAGFGHEVMVEDKPKFQPLRKQYKPIDMSGFRQPVNGYQAKQRKRKLKRRGGK